MALRGEKIAVLGDLHGKWNQRDNEFFDRAGYDLLIFVGDLGGGTAASEREVIRSLRSLRVPSLVMPGNNDAHFLDMLYGDGTETPSPPASLMTACGYSNHLISTRAGTVSVVAGRPCAMGGSEFSFGRELEKRYGVTGLEHSAGRLKRLVDECPTESLIFLAHNGPFGLGGAAESPWARDFRLPEEMEEASPKDWGDSDLTEAIDYARAQGKSVLAVVAGHMHRSSRGGKRVLVTERDGSSFLNAAVVPRIVTGQAGERHHFVRLELHPGASGTKVQLTEVWQDLAGPTLLSALPTAAHLTN